MSPRLPPRPRILIVENDANARSALVELLGDAGYEVCAAPDGVEALGLVPSFRPDLVLTDVRMPRMDGLELARALRQPSALGAEVPIVIMSASQPAGVGVSSYVAKPIHVPILFDVIRNALTRPHGVPNVTMAKP